MPRTSPGRSLKATIKLHRVIRRTAVSLKSQPPASRICRARIYESIVVKEAIVIIEAACQLFVVIGRTAVSLQSQRPAFRIRRARFLGTRGWLWRGFWRRSASRSIFRTAIEPLVIIGWTTVSH
jgi:hypothetical protein